MQRAGLPFGAHEDLDNYVPSERFHAFVVNMAYREGIEDLGFLVGQAHGANCADPHLSDLLRRSPTLYQGFLRTGELANRTVSRSRMGIARPPRGEHAFLFHRPSCDARSAPIHQVGWFGLMSLIGTVRMFAGPRWQPTEIGVMTRAPLSRLIREQFPNTCIRLSQPCSYIALKNELLSLPPLRSEAAMPSPSPLACEALSNDFVGSLKQLLRAYVQGGGPSIDLAAELCHMSTRSLQRKLKEEGTRYWEVLDEVRFDVANRMLQDADVKVIDVAHLLGYRHSTHFSRAFRRIAGVSPQVYRQAYSC